MDQDQTIAFDSNNKSLAGRPNQAEIYYAAASPPATFNLESDRVNRRKLCYNKTIKVTGGPDA